MYYYLHSRRAGVHFCMKCTLFIFLKERGNKQMHVYHVVTDRPMYVGQKIIFDESHHSGVYQRVQEKIEIVNKIYANPSEYNADELEHHTSVALRELALEEVRQKKYPHYPSRMSCLYVSETFEEAENWGKFFAQIGRPTYCIVKLEVNGSFLNRNFIPFKTTI